ncbi:MAG: hypothetical protein ABI625_08175 [bacterium]
MRHQITMLGLAACLASASITGCRSGGAYDVGRVQDAVGLVVRNDNFYDVDVYAIADVLATRIGSVNGNATQRFELSPSLSGAADLRIVATPIGGNGRASSGQLFVSRGQTIFFTVAAQLRQSSATVH